MNILLVNHYAGSPQHGMEYRPFHLAREWSRVGHEVTIVAASHSHLRTQQPQVAANMVVQVIEGVRYVWLRTPAYSGNGANRLLNIAAFVMQMRRCRRSLATRYRPDVVIASSTYRFEAYAAHWIAATCTAKLIYEVRDLWPLTQIELGGMPRWHPFVILLQSAEDFAYRHADCVVTTLCNAEGYVREHGLEDRPCVFVPNGIDLAEWQSRRSPPPDHHTRVLHSLREQGRFIVGYAGTHGLANGLDTLIESAAILSTSPIAFVLVGQGPEKERLERRARQIGLMNVFFLGSVPSASIPSLLASMDALYLGWSKRPLYRFGISPNKLMDYMMAARPVLHSVAAANDPVAEAGCGISCPAENPAALAGAIIRLAGLESPERIAMGHRGRTYVLRHHDYAVLAQRFLQPLVSANGTEQSVDYCTDGG